MIIGTRVGKKFDTSPFLTYFCSLKKPERKENNGTK